MSEKPEVRIIVEQGKLNEREYVFTDRTQCIVGRDSACVAIHTPDLSVSRVQFELDINPPELVIRELGSKYGTEINGRVIGIREEGETPEQGAGRVYGNVPLQDGDEITFGFTETGKARPIRLRVQVRGVVSYAIVPRMPLEKRQQAAQQRETVAAQAREAFFQDAEPKALRLLKPETYEILDILGKGGMGQVYRARHLPTDTFVAVKMVRSELETNEETLAYFGREIFNQNRLDHPNIVALHGVYPGEDFLCIVMDYCEGGSLNRFYGKPLAPQEALPLMIELLTGLEVAHAAGIVHRDIKPGNVLLTYNHRWERYRPRVADFGLAKALDDASLTLTGSAGGTYEFMSRQQVKNFKYAEPAVDVWASAAIFYWLLTGGETPREFPGGKATARTVLHTKPKPILEHNPAIPRPLAILLDHALADEDELIFKTAFSLREELENVEKS